ncbi:endonuclease [Aurantimonas sp. MSK8Z-1]|uniref:endonuclease/exonuclease/phosphatase family protein n=1 Tax=Mangrovibrevibacter kandeliae TaxID=2968473 RepID=UPI002117D492|nr:endonuclease/exonuclease/phosphatase family protein [Aurantimonas sp. MSK8Z-1]MCW4115064.1 endonuclease [Aurantimonas sp. MSK8Z-1]
MTPPDAGIGRTLVDSFTPVSREAREALSAAPRTADAHRRALADVAALGEVRVGPVMHRGPLAFPFTALAWNLERGLYPQASAELMISQGPAVVLACEVDHGMARTAQRDTARLLSRDLGLQRADAVEFLELGLGNAQDRRVAMEAENALGFHGNLLLAATPVETAALVRLDVDGRWFVEDAGQPRIGGRMAVAARLMTVDGPFWAVATHLESRATAAEREVQAGRLLDALDALAGETPVLIGGDMNTGNEKGGDWRREGLLRLVRERGYAAHDAGAEVTTRESHLSPGPARGMKLDWFFSRGLEVAASWIVPALAPDGTPLSDHEMIACRIQGFSAGRPS